MKIYRHLKAIINNERLLFMSSYWRTIVKIFKIKLKYFTAYHPQINR